MTVKSALSTTGKGLLIAVTAINNAPIRSRIYDIDAEISELLKEKAELEAKLV